MKNLFSIVFAFMIIITIDVRAFNKQSIEPDINTHISNVKLSSIDDVQINITPENHVEVSKINIVRGSKQYVYFNHNSSKVDKNGLNAIYKSSGYLKNNSTIHIKSFISSKKTNQYNIDLSKRRVDLIISKLICSGIPFSKIKVEYTGEVNTADGNNIDLSRRVELIVSE